MNEEQVIITKIFGVWFLCMIILISIGAFISNKRINRNEAEIGLRIDNDERECYEFCEGEEYLYKSGYVGGLFSSGYPSSCQCKPTLVRIEE